MSVHLSARCLCQVLQLPDEINGRNGVLALCPEEFGDLVLFNPKVEIASTWTTCCASCGGTARCNGGIPSGVCVVCGVVHNIVVMVVIFLMNQDIITSGILTF
jgi:hypothetical protein